MSAEIDQEDDVEPAPEGWNPDECCEKCHDIDTEHTWPAHTVHNACINLHCDCHKKCDNECRYQEPYGFVPEAGCPIHDK